MENIQMYAFGGAAIIIIVLAIYFGLRWNYRKNTREDIYLCIEYFIRNLHELSFYHPKIHRSFSEYSNLYASLKRDRHKWYFSEKWREFIDSFLTDFEKADTFIKTVSAYMGENHFFSHSEYLICKPLADFDSFKAYIDQRFLKVVNKVEMLSFSHENETKLFKKSI